MVFGEAKKMIREIEFLREKIKTLEKDSVKSQIQEVIANIHLSVDFEPNTKVLIQEATDKMLDEFKQLFEYEIGERMKKLNIKEDENHIGQS